MRPQTAILEIPLFKEFPCLALPSSAEAALAPRQRVAIRCSRDAKKTCRLERSTLATAPCRGYTT